MGGDGLGQDAPTDRLWALVDANALEIGMPAVFVDESQFPNAAQHGLEPFLGASRPDAEEVWPASRGLAVDASDRYKITLVETEPVEQLGSLVEHVVVSVATGRFPQPHPETWWRQAHDEHKRVLLLVGPLQQHAHGDGEMMLLFLINSRCATAPLLTRAWPTGIGTRPQEQRDIE